MKMSNKTYDVLKFIASVALPAVAAFYLTLSQIWGLPYGEEIVGTITAVDALMGALLMLDSAKYHKNIAAAEENLVDNKGE